MKILAYFTYYSSPAVGLSPTIRIRDLSDNSLLVTDAAMTEVGDGKYEYDFSAYQSSKNYVVRCYGGSSLPPSERYAYCVLDNRFYTSKVWIAAFFTEDNAPATGLSPLPTIRIRDLADDSLEVTDADMAEVGDGVYKYDFSTFASAKDYGIRCDAGSTFVAPERFKFGALYAMTLVAGDPETLMVNLPADADVNYSIEEDPGVLALTIVDEPLELTLEVDGTLEVEVDTGEGLDLEI